MVVGPADPEVFFCAAPVSKLPTDTICGPETSLATIGVAVVAVDTDVRLAVLRMVCPVISDLLLFTQTADVTLCCWYGNNSGLDVITTVAWCSEEPDTAPPDLVTI